MNEKISQDRRNSFKYCTINPGLIWGPSRGIRVSESMEWIQRIMLNKHGGVPKISIPFCDVRDVAQIHIKAME